MVPALGASSPFAWDGADLPGQTWWTQQDPYKALCYRNSSERIEKMVLASEASTQNNPPQVKPSMHQLEDKSVLLPSLSVTWRSTESQVRPQKAQLASAKLYCLQQPYEALFQSKLVTKAL